jgi:hypothetical protein
VCACGWEEYGIPLTGAYLGLPRKALLRPYAPFCALLRPFTLRRVRYPDTPSLRVRCAHVARTLRVRSLLVCLRGWGWGLVGAEIGLSNGDARNESLDGCTRTEDAVLLLYSRRTSPFLFMPVLMVFLF